MKLSGTDHLSGVSRDWNAHLVKDDAAGGQAALLLVTSVCLETCVPRQPASHRQLGHGARITSCSRAFLSLLTRESPSMFDSIHEPALHKGTAKIIVLCFHTLCFLGQDVLLLNYVLSETVFPFYSLVNA